jgi:hypothetical protein
VSLLTAVRFHPALTSVNHPHLIVALQLWKLLPTRLANPSNPPVRRTNRESPMQNPKLHRVHRVRRASGFVQIPYRKCAGVMLFRSPRMLRAGALVDRALRFLNTNQANKFGLILVVVPSSQENA